MKTPHVTLDDGLSNEGAYLTIEVPFEWLTEEAFEGDEDIDNTVFIDLDELIQMRFAKGRCPMDGPTASSAKATIEMLRRYADLLENTFVLSSDAYEWPVPGPDEDKNRKPIFINADKEDAKVWVTAAETDEPAEGWSLTPCKNGHSEIRVENGTVQCLICGDKETREWNKAAVWSWNFSRHHWEEE